MTGLRQPHREMAADGARTENTYLHGVEILLRDRRVSRQFPQACAAAQPADAIKASRAAESDGSRPDASGILPCERLSTRRNPQCVPIRFYGISIRAASRRSR